MAKGQSIVSEIICLTGFIYFPQRKIVVKGDHLRTLNVSDLQCTYFVGQYKNNNDKYKSILFANTEIFSMQLPESFAVDD